MSEDWELKVCCMGAGYVGGPTMAVIAKQCPKVSHAAWEHEGHCDGRYNDFGEMVPQDIQSTKELFVESFILWETFGGVNAWSEKVPWLWLWSFGWSSAIRP